VNGRASAPFTTILFGRRRQTLSAGKTPEDYCA
jgi:hypothetical protein